MSEDRRETGGLRLFIKAALLVGADALIGPLLRFFIAPK